MAELTAKQREAWIGKLRLELERLINVLRDMEQNGKKNTSQYKEQFVLFTKRLATYEEAQKRHEAKQLAENSPNTQ